MLHEATNAGFEEGRSLVGRHYRLIVGTEVVGPTVSRRSWRRLDEVQATIAVAVGELRDRRYWLYRHRIWWERENLGPADVEALADECLDRKQRRLERARDALHGPRPAPGIPREVRLAVFDRRGPLRRVRLAGPAAVRSCDPGRARRLQRGREPAAALRCLQPGEGGDARLTRFTAMNGPRVIVVGAGFGGIAATIELKRHGFGDVTVLDRADQLGGTWHHNRYPGAACDVPSHLYSFSYAQRRDWSRLCSPQEEILDYMGGVARDFGVAEQIVPGSEVTSCAWDEDARNWTVTTARGATLRGRRRDPRHGAAASPGLSARGGPRQLRRAQLPLRRVGP